MNEINVELRRRALTSMSTTTNPSVPAYILFRAAEKIEELQQQNQELTSALVNAQKELSEIADGLRDSQVTMGAILGVVP